MFNSKVILAKDIKLDKDYVNVLSYSESQMLTLLQDNSHLVYKSETANFIRNTGTVQVKATYEQCLQANYIAFQNPDYSNKWFFGFIDNVIFKGKNLNTGEGNNEIEFTIDAWSTWFDYWTKKPCFIVREHVNDDTIGLHTVPEDLNVGQLISDYSAFRDEIGAESYFWWVIACNYNPSDQQRYAGVSAYGDYPQGSMWFAWLINYNNYATEVNQISDWVYNVTQAGQDGNIQAMFGLPYQAFSLADVDATTHLVTSGGGRKLNTDFTLTKASINSFSDYTPKNNKLKVYPYSFLRVSNNNGSVNDYKIEDFSSAENVEFNVIGVPCIGYSGKLRPKNYQGYLYNEDEAIPLGKYPTFSWSSDGFTNWMTQNAVNIGINAVSTAINALGSFMKGDFVGSFVTPAANIASTIGSMVQASMGSNTAQGNANAGDVNFSQNLTRFKIAHMRPKKEYLEIIDDYFSRYGYKINRVKQPNIVGRTYWNYVEIGATEEIGNGSVPSSFMNQINGACRKGVTIWHNHENVGNFALNNTIVNP